MSVLKNFFTVLLPVFLVIGQTASEEVVLNNFIHHKSGSNEYRNKQTNITKLTLSVRVYQQKHNSQPCVRMCLQNELLTELYEAKNLVLVLLTKHLVIQI